MMSFESRLIRLVLEECWRRGYRVVNIHDALIVLQVEKNMDVTVDELKSIIETVYHRSMLYPSVKVEMG